MIHHTITLQSGTEVYFRPIQPDDADLLMAMHRRVSRASLTSRYFQPYMPTQQELTEICGLDSRRGGGYIASANHEIVGLGYYVVADYEAAAAETAFLVQDSFQGRGIGRTLFHMLAQHALKYRVHAFDAYMQATNEPMMRIFRKAGFALEANVSYGIVEVHLDLTVRNN